ncbi:MAG: amine oxidase [Nitrospira sp.]|jgi:monoamine oxidase|nr:amine oxidase [Nitrospira sp.]
MRNAAEKKAAEKRVIIIGAGLAGLSCAYHLRERGFSSEEWEIIIIESRDRVGGRVETLRKEFTENLSAEAGAFWVSEDHRLALDYVRKFELDAHGELSQVVLPGTTLPYYFRRLEKLIPLHESGQAVDLAKRSTPEIPWPTLTNPKEAAAGFWGLLGRYICTQTALVDPCQPAWPSTKLSLDLQSCDDVSFLTFLRMRGASDEAIELIRPWFGWWDDLDQISALSVFRDGAVARQMCQDPQTKWYTLKSGMDALPQEFKKRLDAREKNVRTILEAPVTEIMQGQTGISITYKKDGQEQKIQGTYLVSAIPFSTLRDIRNLPFSSEKLHAIRNLPYATVARVYLQCKERVWDREDKFNGVAFLDLPDDLPNDPGVCRMNLLDMTYARRKDTPQGIIQAYMVGMLGERVTAMKDAESVQFTLDQLEKVYPGLKKSYNAAGSHHATRCWDKEKWSLGAYPLFRPGQMFELVPHIQRSEGRTFFAGDHTWGRPGWMEGALQSGHRAAKDIVVRAAIDKNN